MRVKELIEFLQKQPQELPVIYSKFSEYCLLDVKTIERRFEGEARPDGWVHGKRPDKPVVEYICFPGN